MFVGIACIVLEASDRYGGRVKNDRLTSSSDGRSLNIYIGANWIHGLDPQQNPMVELANMLNLSLHRTSSDYAPGEDVLLFDGKSPQPEQVSKESYAKLLERYSYIKAAVGKHIGEDKSVKSVLESSCKDSVNIFGTMDESELRCLQWCYDRIQIDLACELDQASSIECFETDLKADSDSDADSEDNLQESEALVLGGYYQIIKHLFEEYPLQVRFNHVASRITSNSDCAVTIECVNGVQFKAKACLVTVPIGVLHQNDITFHPAIPPRIQSIRDSCQPGLMNTIWLWFPYQFWPSGSNFIGLTREMKSKPGFTTFLIPPIYDDRGERQPVLMCQVIGDLAVEIESKTEDEVGRMAVDALREIFGDELPELIACKHSRWLSNPFAKCSWSYLPINNRVDSVDHPVIDESSVFYAGEADYGDHRGTAHGAYLSGNARALEIIEYIVK
jgi:monoamine oxidase